MAEDKFIMFRNRLEKVYRHLGKQARRVGVTCYRLYDHDLPEFPFCIEIYEQHIYIAEYKRRQFSSLCKQRTVPDNQPGKWPKSYNC